MRDVCPQYELCYFYPSTCLKELKGEKRKNLSENQRASHFSVLISPFSFIKFYFPFSQSEKSRLSSTCFALPIERWMVPGGWM